MIPFDVKSPLSSDLFSQIFAVIRSIKQQFKERFSLDHNMNDVLDTALPTADGYHNQVTMPEYVEYDNVGTPSYVPTHLTDSNQIFVKKIDGLHELCINNGNNSYQITKNNIKTVGPDTGEMIYQDLSDSIRALGYKVIFSTILNKYLAIYNSQVAVSDDCISWTPTSISLATRVASVLEINGKIIIYLDYSSTAYWTTDGISFTSFTITGLLRGPIAYGIDENTGLMTVAYVYSTGIYWSTDGINFSYRYAGTCGDNYSSIGKYKNGYFFFWGYNSSTSNNVTLAWTKSPSLNLDIENGGGGITSIDIMGADISDSLKIFFWATHNNTGYSFIVNTVSASRSWVASTNYPTGYATKVLCVGDTFVIFHNSSPNNFYWSTNLTNWTLCDRPSGAIQLLDYIKIQKDGSEEITFVIGSGLVRYYTYDGKTFYGVSLDPDAYYVEKSPIFRNNILYTFQYRNCSKMEIKYRKIT